MMKNSMGPKIVCVFCVSANRFKPPDVCYIELMRFRVRKKKNRELPIQLKAVMCVTGNKVQQGPQTIVMYLKKFVTEKNFLCILLVSKF
jgi:hypothetical protein